MCSSPVGRADWLTLTSGAKGTSDPTAASEFWFETPHGPPVVAVTQVTGGGTVQATTGGGTSFFGGLGTPVLLTLGDGSAYLAGGEPPPNSRIALPGVGAVILNVDVEEPGLEPPQHVAAVGCAVRRTVATSLHGHSSRASSSASTHPRSAMTRSTLRGPSPAPVSAPPATGLEEVTKG